MDKPPYELFALRKAVLQEHTNINAFQEGIDKSRAKIRELENYIRQWERYNEHSGQPDSHP